MHMSTKKFVTGNNCMLYKALMPLNGVTDIMYQLSIQGIFSLMGLTSADSDNTLQSFDILSI